MQPLPSRHLPPEASKKVLHSTIWPRSHTRIWHHLRGCMRDNRPYQVYEDTAYEGEVAMVNQCLRQIKQDIEPVEAHGPAGTVVLVSAAAVGSGLGMWLLPRL